MNIIDEKNCLILIIDVQEKLVSMLEDKSVGLNAVKIAKTAGILKLPTVITEQYPKGLGLTLSDIKTSIPDAKYIEKTHFSALKEDGFESLLTTYNKKQIVIFGIETHICVLQTAFDLYNKGYEVFIIKDACGSRTNENKETALQRLRHLGCQTITVEMFLFELLKSSKHENFKEIQSLIK